MTVETAILIAVAVVLGAFYAVRPFRPSASKHPATRVVRALLRLVAGVVGIALLGCVVLLVLVVRACSTSTDPFVARVIDATDAQICLQRVGGGPAYIDGCHPRDYIVDLPKSIRAGLCIQLKENHPSIVYLAYKDCPTSP